MAGNPSTDISLEDEAHYFTGRLLIPDDRLLHKQIWEVKHDSKVAGHMGQHMTIELVKPNFISPDNGKFIKDYVRSYLQGQSRVGSLPCSVETSGTPRISHTEYEIQFSWTS
jgi:hypothetical protein